MYSPKAVQARAIMVHLLCKGVKYIKYNYLIILNIINRFVMRISCTLARLLIGVLVNYGVRDDI